VRVREGVRAAVARSCGADLSSVSLIHSKYVLEDANSQPSVALLFVRQPFLQLYVALAYAPFRVHAMRKQLCLHALMALYCPGAFSQKPHAAPAAFGASVPLTAAASADSASSDANVSVMAVLGMKYAL